MEMKTNKIKYFDNEISMVVVNNCLAIGRFDSETFLVESVFSNESYLDIMSADECKEVYGVDPTEISYFTLN